MRENDNNNNNNNREIPRTPERQVLPHTHQPAPPPLRRHQRHIHIGVPTGLPPIAPTDELPLLQVRANTQPNQEPPAHSHYNRMINRSLEQPEPTVPRVLPNFAPREPVHIPTPNQDRLDAAGYMGEIPNEFICPITRAIMDRPVRHPQEQHRFNEPNLRDWLMYNGRTNPINRQLMYPDDLVHDTELQARIDAFMEQALGQRNERSGEEPDSSNKRFKM